MVVVKVAEANHLKVLFVDDEENILRSLSRLFFEEEMETFVATSGREGLELLKKERMAVIVSDQRMPEMSGGAFLEKAREISPDSVRIVLTGYADVVAAVDAINKGGAYRYIAKPWNDSELISVVRDAADRYRLLMENRHLTELTKRQNEELQKWSAELENYVQQQTVDLTRQNQELSRLNTRLSDNLEAFISSFSNLIEFRDRKTASHSYTVAKLSAEICLAMGLGQEDLQCVARAAKLHDIGKIGTSDVVFLKDEVEMTQDEIEEYRHHSIRGQAAVDAVDELREAGLMIRHHHEAMDGSGFPDGLKGDAIPLGARIISVADRFDRIAKGTHDINGVEKAFAHIRSRTNREFDGDITRLLPAALEKNRNLFLQDSDTADIELTPRDLQTGMVISRDLKTGTGLLLLSKGMVLTEHNIEITKRCYHFDPLKTGIYVWVDRKRPAPDQI